MKRCEDFYQRGRDKSQCNGLYLERGILKSRIMYVENKSDGLTGTARIGLIQFSKTGRTLYYGGKSFQSLKGSGYKSNYYDVETGEEYWISGCKKDGSDRLYGERVPIEIDDDVREEYWLDIRQMPHQKEQKQV